MKNQTNNNDGLLTKAIKEIYNTVEPEDILSEDKIGRLYLRGQMMTDTEIMVLQNEATELVKTKIWKIMTETVIKEARDLMFEKAENIDHIRVGKALLYNVNTLINIVNKVNSYKFAKSMPSMLQYMGK